VGFKLILLRTVPMIVFLLRSPLLSRGQTCRLQGSLLLQRQLLRRSFSVAPPQSHQPTSDELSPKFFGIDIPKRFLKQSIQAPDSFNRWWIPPAAISLHMSIGSVYAWSIFNTPLTRELGGVVSAASDWGLSEVVPCFGTAICFLGLSAAVGSKWMENVGPRATGLLSAACWGGGHVVAAAGVSFHSLPLLIFGYGVLGGCGLGLGYVTPVGTLVRWFPDRKGMATGFAVAGFGGGAMVAGPLNRKLLEHNFVPPEYLGPLDSVPVVTEAGRRFVELEGELKEVVVATAKELLALPVEGLSEGVYLVGTGNCGAAATFLTLGVVYGVVISAAAMAIRIPSADWKPQGWDPNGVQASKRSLISSNHVHIDNAAKTPQFWMLWAAIGCNITAGISVIGCATTMIKDIFGAALPHIADSTFCANYVAAIAVFSIIGRIGWGTASDYLGRKNTFGLFFCLGMPLYLTIPFAANAVSTNPSATPLVLFYCSTMVIFSMYGGAFATLPAYIADLFGSKFVGGIHGRILTAWSVAGVCGPQLLAHLRQTASNTAILELVAKVDPAVFQRSFGCPVENVHALIDAKSVTIENLLAIAPEGTFDPTPYLYDSTMYTMAGLLSVGFLSNALITPVASKWHMPENCLPVESKKV